MHRAFQDSTDLFRINKNTLAPRTTFFLNNSVISAELCAVNLFVYSVLFHVTLLLQLL